MSKHLSHSSPNIVRIGFFPDGLDSMILQRDHPKLCFYAIVLEDSPDLAWAKHVIPRPRIIVVRPKTLLPGLMSISLEDWLRRTDLKRCLARHALKGLIIDGRISATTHAWAKAAGLKLFPTSYGHQRRFEDKVFFDRFLKKHHISSPQSAIYRYDPKAPLPPLKGALVLQTRDSSGAEGTYFIKEAAQIPAKLKAQNIKGGSVCLVRRYTTGIPCGISAFVAPQLVALSGIRRQCYELWGDGPGIFAGVQWLPSQLLKRAARERINQTFLRLALYLHACAYFGFANFDFILTPNDQVLTLECNARFSAATTSMLCMPELLGGVDAGALIRERLIRRTTYARKPKSLKMPDLDFEGSSLRLFFVPSGVSREAVIQGAFENGVYTLQKNRPYLLSYEPTVFDRRGLKFIFCSSAKRGEIYKKTVSLGYIHSNFPLFSETGLLNPRGRQLRDLYLNTYLNTYMGDRK